MAHVVQPHLGAINEEFHVSLNESEAYLLTIVSAAESNDQNAFTANHQPLRMALKWATRLWTGMTSNYLP